MCLLSFSLLNPTWEQTVKTAFSKVTCLSLSKVYRIKSSSEIQQLQAWSLFKLNARHNILGSLFLLGRKPEVSQKMTGSQTKNSFNLEEC